MTNTTFKTVVMEEIPDKHKRIRRHNGTPSCKSLFHFNKKCFFCSGKNELKS
jgi:hypothetical protein